MKKEMLYTVDENDNIIGEIERKEAHEKGILHRGAVILVFNKRERF